MRDIHPFVVLSPQNFNATTSLVIGVPMTTASYNANNPFAVAVGVAKSQKISYVPVTSLNRSIGDSEEPLRIL